MLTYLASLKDQGYIKDDGTLADINILVLLYDSARTITAAVRALEKVDNTLDAHRRRQGKTNGVAVEPKKTK